MRLADLAIGLSWIASRLADFEERRMVWKSRDGHGADEAKGNGDEGRELHFEIDTGSTWVRRLWYGIFE